MSLLDAFKASPAWDPRYGLIILPNENNPWIYGAYADLILRLNGEKQDMQPYIDHFVRCENAVTLQDPKQFDVGCFARWPDGSGGLTSHDEIMGAAYFAPWIAQRILAHLERSGGVMNNNGSTSWIPFHFNVYRMIWVKPYLLARARYEVNYFYQAMWSLNMLFGAFKRPPGDVGGRLRNWMMIHEMNRFPLCAIAIQIWCKFVGLTPRECLVIEPRGNFPLDECQNLEDWRSVLALQR